MALHNAAQKPTTHTNQRTTYQLKNTKTAHINTAIAAKDTSGLTENKDQ